MGWVFEAMERQPRTQDQGDHRQVTKQLTLKGMCNLWFTIGQLGTSTYGGAWYDRDFARNMFAAIIR